MSLPNLNDLLDRHFNLDELRRLCLDLSIEFENLSGETRMTKAQSLLEFCLRHDRLPELVERVEKARPNVEWPDVESLAEEWQKVQQGIAAQEGLRGILPDEQVAATLALLQEKEAGLLVQLTGSGAMAVGEQAVAVGERGVKTDSAETIITGDNNSMQTIINQYGDAREAPPDPEALQAQIGAYLTWLLDRAGTIELRGIQRQGEQVVQLPLEKVYVPLAASTYGRRSAAIEMDEILRLGRRLILTGGPGSGKTTVLLHIAWSLAQAIAADDLALARKLVGFEPATWERATKEKPDEVESLPLPIFVPLSLYAGYRRGVKTKEDRTLAAFISHYLFDRQTSFDLPADFFRLLLRQGQAVILLLDGLDEVPDESERVQVRQAIEDLVTGRENMRIVVTCRINAYQGRTALGKGFREIAVQPLKEKQMAALVRQAYAHIYQHDPLRREQKTEELQQGIAQLESERQKRLGQKATRLIDSPLLVRLMLIVHYRERRLPEQRAELFMKATDAMLLPDYAPDVETADFIGQFVGGNMEVHRDMMQHLAFHMHRRGEKQGREIAERDLRRVLSAEPAYAPLVDPLVQLTRLRGTLLEERLGRYRFLHLAFQEYLAARYLAEIVRSEGGIQAVMAFLGKGPLLESWWREVILLIAGYFSVTSPQTAQAFLERLANIDKAAPDRETLSPEEQLAGAELAAVGWLEWPAQRAELGRRLTTRLVALIFTDESLPVTSRIAANPTLAQLGDSRPGVGYIEKQGQKIPDIAWGKEVPAGTHAYQDTTVAIQQSFCLARFPVTQDQFQCFLDAPDFDEQAWWTGIPESEQKLSAPAFPYGNHPRERVSWYQAIAFCRWLSDKLGYIVDLPHEYEWEVAARYPDQRLFPWGDEFDRAKANTRESGIRKTTPVGSFPAGRNSTLALYDLSGNVWEWCRNKFADPDARDTMEISTGWRPLRGGSWNLIHDDARASSRVNYHSDDRYHVVGFRLVVRRSPSQIER